MAVADERREGCDGCGRVVSLEALTTVTMPDGEAIACCPECEPHAREAARKLSSLDTQRGCCDGCDREFPQGDLEDAVLSDGTVVTCCPACLTEVPGCEGGGSSTGRADADSTGQNHCTQCREWTDEELLQVTTTDGRTEEMCGACKDDLEREGVVVEVAMRTSRAHEILDVEPGATEPEIRTAFLQQVKHAHPDRETGSRSAFKLVKEAYDRLI
ncbi:J domain-containing protein [Natrialbaceae archaeon A-gly3]